MLDARIIDLAIKGRCAASRLAARFNRKPDDQEEVIRQAGARIEHTFSCWGHGPAVIDYARALMVDAFREASGAA